MGRLPPLLPEVRGIDEVPSAGARARSTLPGCAGAAWRSFIASKTIRKHRSGILAAIRLGINNARHEGLNRRVRLRLPLLEGALALVMLSLGPIEHVLPHERVPEVDP